MTLLPAPVGPGYTYNRGLQRLLLWMKSAVRHENVMRFLGVTESDGLILSVSEYCSKGILRDILEVGLHIINNNKLYLDTKIQRKTLFSSFDNSN